MGKLCIATSLTLAALAAGGSASATDRMEARAVAVAVPPANAAVAAEDIAIVILLGQEQLWSGSLGVGGQYGSASYSQSTSEFAEPCGSDGKTSTYASSSRQLNFSISRRDWQQEPDKFYVNVNWSQPLAPCEGEGASTTGFNRVVVLPQGRAVTVSAPGGLSLRLTRQS